MGLVEEMQMDSHKGNYSWINEKYPQNSAAQGHNLCVESWESEWEKFSESGKQICECSSKIGLSGKRH